MNIARLVPPSLEFLEGEVLRAEAVWLQAHEIYRASPSDETAIALRNAAKDLDRATPRLVAAWLVKGGHTPPTPA